MLWSAGARGSLQAEPMPWVARGCSAAGSCGELSGLPVGRTGHTLHTLLDTSLRGCVLGRAFPTGCATSCSPVASSDKHVPSWEGLTKHLFSRLLILFVSPMKLC